MSLQGTLNLRPLKKVSVYIEEDHNDVLSHIFRCVGAKLLPTTGNVLLHFDSHPDLGLPFNLHHKVIKGHFLFGRHDARSSFQLAVSSNLPVIT